MKIKHTDVVTEYLHELDLRLSGLPVLQRRELLAEITAHIAAERTERNIRSDGELIEVLERLGSPEVVAAAAYDEAGTRPPIPSPRRRRLSRTYLVAGVLALVAMMLVLCGALTFARGSSPGPTSVQPVPGASG